MKFSSSQRLQLFLASAAGALLLGSGLVVRAAEGPLSIRNKSLQVTFEPSQGQFTIARVGSERPFVTGGRFARSHGTARAFTPAELWRRWHASFHPRRS